MTSQHILVVDDEPVVRRWLTAILEAAGYQVSCAADGQEALVQLEELRPDALILDMRMPRMDGYGVLTTLRTQQHTLPIIVLTASDRARVQAIEGFSPAATAVKPIDKAWLLDRLQAHLGPPGQGKGAREQE